jgi:hypothetical protein
MVAAGILMRAAMNAQTDSWRTVTHLILQPDGMIRGIQAIAHVVG